MYHLPRGHRQETSGSRTVLREAHFQSDVERQGVFILREVLHYSNRSVDGLVGTDTVPVRGRRAKEHM